MEKQFYQKETAQVMEELQTSMQGLDAQEAQRRLERDGRNELEESKPPHPLMIFLSQFQRHVNYSCRSVELHVSSLV